MPVPVDLSKLSDVVKNDVVNKNVFDKLVAKVNSIDTSVFVLKTKHDTDKRQLEKKISDTSDLVKKTDCTAKMTEMEGKIPSVSVLATNAALTTVENKIPNISTLVKKTDYNTKITEIKKKLTDHNHDKWVEVDMSSSVHVYNKKKDILIIGKGSTLALGEHSLTIERMYSINFTVTRKKLSLSLHYNRENSYFLLMVSKSLNSKQKILRLLKLQYV